jgi:hypothetical protein
VVGRGRRAGTRETGAPQGRDPPPQHLDPLSRPPARRMQIAALHGPGARRGGPARGRGRRPPPRAACSPGECGNPGRAECCPGRSSGARDGGGDGSGSGSRVGGSRGREEGDPGFPGDPAGADERGLGGRWLWPRLGQDGESGAHAHR